MSVQIDPRVDHYKVLGVAPEASGDDIKKAYRRLAKKYHPDSTGGDKVKEAKFKEIGHAYDILGDKDKRTQYDALRAGTSQFHDFQGFPGAGGAVDLGDIFSQMFQGGARRGNVNVRFSGGGPAGFGAEFPPGFQPGFQDRPRRRRDPAHQAAHQAEHKIKLSDGSPAIQRGADVLSDLRLSLDQAILGTVCEVATATGKSKVKVPPGTSSGVKLRLKEKGMPTASGGHGHHYVTIQIDVPKNIDEKATQLLMQFMQQAKR